MRAKLNTLVPAIGRTADSTTAARRLLLARYWLTEAAAVFVFALTPILWALTSSAFSIVSLLVAILMVVVAILLTGPHQIADPRIALLFLAFVAVYAIGMSYSFLMVTQPHPDRQSLYVAHCTELALCVVAFAFGALSARGG